MTQNTSRRAIIYAAERLIAEHGLSALTLEAVQNAAGQLNKSAAKYHFGSREGLLYVIIETRMSRVNERRLAQLDQLGSPRPLVGPWTRWSGRLRPRPWVVREAGTPVF